MEELAPARSLARHPLFQVMLNLQNAARADVDFTGVQVSGVQARQSVAKFDLDIAMSEDFDDAGTPAGLRGALTGTADLFDPASVQRFAQWFVRVVEQMAADPGVRLSAVSLLDGAERHRVVVEWNDTAVDVPALTLPELFEQQAARAPGAVAVVCEGADGDLSYGELDARANRLARYADRPGRRSGVAGGGGDGPRGGSDGRVAGRGEGRRRLCASGSGVSGGPDRVHADRRGAGVGAGFGGGRRVRAGRYGFPGTGGGFPRHRGGAAWLERGAGRRC